jgi:hypothetical protein
MCDVDGVGRDYTKWLTVLRLLMFPIFPVPGAVLDPNDFASARYCTASSWRSMAFDGVRNHHCYSE